MNRRNLAAAALVGLTLACTLGLPAAAQELPNLPGHILPFPKPAQADAALAANAERIARLILAQPSLAAPVGFSVRPSLQVKTPLENMPAGTPRIARVLLLLQRIDPAAGKPPGEGSGVGPGIFIDLNDHTALFDDAPTNVRVQQRVPLQAPRMRNGFQVWERAGSTTLVLALNDRPLFRPVTRAEYLADLIAPLEEAIAELSKVTAPTALKAEVEKLRAEQAALSPAEASAPACEADTLSARFKPCRDGEVMVARVNHEYFDHHAPLGSVQLITINANTRDSGGLHEPIRAAIAALAAGDLNTALNR